VITEITDFAVLDGLGRVVAGGFNTKHDQHRGSERAFWDRLGIEPGAVASDLYETYCAGGDGLSVLMAHVQRRAA
jgi:hypothetical protein